MVRSSLRDEEKAEVRERSEGNEFDLQHLYHDAVECLVSCDLTILSLREQLASKDKIIKSLEDKIVQMSFELASAKAMQDEMQLKRMSRSKETDHEVSSPLISSREFYDRSNITRKNRAGHYPRPMLSRSWPTRNDPMNKQRTFLGSSGLRSSCIVDASRVGGNNISDKDDTKENGFSVTDTILTSDRSPSDSKTNGIMRRNASETALSMASNDGCQQHCSWKFSSDESAPRRLPMIQFLLGLNKSDAIESATNATNIERVNSEDQKERRYQSNPPSIEGVLFPVSSKEAIEGCLSDEDSCESTERPSSRANEEWPEFKQSKIFSNNIC